jgi:hypothetical protein
LFHQAGFTITHSRIDEWFVSRSELKQWRKTFPDSSASLKDLLFTQRGRQLMFSVLKQGGFDMPQLVVMAKLTANLTNPPQTPEPLL